MTTIAVPSNIEDIEDALSSPLPTRSSASMKLGQVKITRRANLNAQKMTNGATDTARQEQVPGVGKIWVKTFGCAHNVSDSEYMAGQLESYGYTVLSEESESLLPTCDCAVINSCTVKGPSETRFLTLVRKCKQFNVPVVVAGCVPQGDRGIPELKDCSIIGVQQIDRVAEAVEETLKGNVVKLLTKSTLPKLDLPKIRRNPLIEIVPLSTGCLGQCTYCKTKHARGKLGSYDLQALVDRVRTVITEGVKEIWFSSEDVGAYGRDLGLKLPDLLKSVTSVLPDDGSVMLRIGMSNPPYMLDTLPELAEALSLPSVFSFLHIPVQAGSNAVLDAMKREYTVEEFCTVSDYLLKHVPGMTIATDIICGFPGETNADWEQTMALCKKYKFPVLNISQFYPRPGTPAATMKQLDSKIKKSRSRELTNEMMTWEPYVNLVNTEQRVWIGNEVSPDQMYSVGHTKSYAKVLVPRDDSLKGKSVMVKIVKSHRWHVDGEILSMVHTKPIQLDSFVVPSSTLTDTKEVPTIETEIVTKQQEEQYQTNLKRWYHLAIVLFVFWFIASAFLYWPQIQGVFGA